MVHDPHPPDAECEVPRPVPYSLRLTLGIHARGRGDPSMRFEVSGSAWRATRTPDGPATLFIEAREGSIRARAWGPGSTWALTGIEGLLGLDDDVGALVPRHPAVVAAVKRSTGLRIGRTRAVLEALLPAILEQKVTGDEARRTLRALVRTHGEDAPGPPGLRLLPTPDVLARLPYHAFHPLGLERRRADLVRAVCRDAVRLERLGEAAAGPDATPDARAKAYAELRAVPGIGPWTAAEVGMRAFGCRERRRLPHPEHGRVGAGRRTARHRRADAGAAGAVPGSAGARDPPPGAGRVRGAALRPAPLPTADRRDLNT
jgi:endonuclease III